MSGRTVSAAATAAAEQAPRLRTPGVGWEVILNMYSTGGLVAHVVALVAFTNSGWASR
jgi:hypothetical protein